MDDESDIGVAAAGQVPEWVEIRYRYLVLAILAVVIISGHVHAVAFLQGSNIARSDSSKENNQDNSEDGKPVHSTTHLCQDGAGSTLNPETTTAIAIQVLMDSIHIT
jgi:hypothetical protein